MRSLSANVLGEASADRALFGRWPSDHAGVVAALALPERLANGAAGKVRAAPFCNVAPWILRGHVSS